MTKTKTRAAYGGLKMKVEDTGRERPAQDPAGAAKGQAGAGRRARGCDAPQPPPTQVVWWLRVDEIAPSPYQTRAHEADGNLDGLAASIRTSGVINPLTVRRRDGASGRLPWELVAGHRRLAAARLAGLAEVPCLVTEMDDAQARLANVIENLQRKDLGPLEQADGVAALTGRKVLRVCGTCRHGGPHWRVRMRGFLMPFLHCGHPDGRVSGAVTEDPRDTERDWYHTACEHWEADGCMSCR